MLPNKAKSIRLTFTFSNQADIKAKNTARIQTWIDFPEAAQHLIRVEERLRYIGKQVGRRSRAVVHIDCKELGITDEIMNETNSEGREKLFLMPTVALLAFKNLSLRRSNSQLLEIVAPHLPENLPRQAIEKRGRNQKERQILANNLNPLYQAWFTLDGLPEYYESLKGISEQVLVLLNSMPIAENIRSQWQFIGFHPYWQHPEIAKRIKKEENRLWNLNAQKPKQENQVSSEHKKGNRVGAIPGIFKGIQFRSQLEIRLATELEARGIQWVYELERLGGGNYLVDFYLPQLKAWIEVKGKFEARDYYLLKEVAEVLKQRQERLYVYTSGKPQRVTGESFTAINKEDFWSELLIPPLS